MSTPQELDLGASTDWVLFGQVSLFDFLDYLSKTLAGMKEMINSKFEEEKGL